MRKILVLTALAAVACSQAITPTTTLTIPQSSPWSHSGPTAFPVPSEGFATTIKSAHHGDSKVPSIASMEVTIASALSLPTTGPVATFTGGNIFTTNCTAVQFLSATLGTGAGTVVYPWMGCSQQERGCCPFDPNVGGSLSVCPQDYVTASGGCCPS